MKSQKKIFILLFLASAFHLSLSQVEETQIGVKKFLFIQQEAQEGVQQQAVDTTNQQNNTTLLDTQNTQNNTNQPVQPTQQAGAQAQNATQQVTQEEEKKEKNLLLVVPFSKEQFEAEMKIQSLKLQDESKKYYQLNLETLKNITVENKKIIDQKKALIKLYLNHTMIYLDAQIQVLQRELEQNHELIIQLASAIMLSTLDHYEQKISQYRIKIEEILLKVDPPVTICKRIMSCQGCTAQQDCVWSTDRRACFVGSKYDGCYFDFCEFYIKDYCFSNAKIDLEEQNMLDHYSEDEKLAKIMDELYDEEDVELVAQRIPQTQKNYYLQLQNKLIDLKDKIQRVRIYINYVKKVYFKLRYQNIIFKRKRKQQKEEDEKFIKQIEEIEEQFLKNIKETEEEKKLTIDDIIKNEKALEIAAKNGNGEANGQQQEEKLIISKDGQIKLSNGQIIEGIIVIDGKVYDQITGEERKDLKVVDGQLVGEDGKPITASQLQHQLEEEQGFMDGLLTNWFGDDYEAPEKTTLSEKDQEALEKEKDETIIDVDSEEIQNEEQTILEYVSDQVQQQNQDKDDE
ncbi:hypothetical protein TTHERM_00628650 (macronuclear) [Tetrahymena thermophila SB210]|uniref:Transmembrane protein n=1 Tax=Tetrahymena thermophila (strain SB210) TaxID=312017 RepID=Q23RT3_TETTS|nr:hypothetical protein TTHERM_00628650 [Tetrahymena thermophila SB210]EAR99306.1 hypothetical protein TTHERM_00628650 [Tetrahymena thermophila SB210]|eukprot:XP_001019551.1 hypothetical protein TTHERM_00628650 [Tetrahymena thermophila SB210]